jgi:hypothetical protein
MDKIKLTFVYSQGEKQSLVQRAAKIWNPAPFRKATKQATRYYVQRWVLVDISVLIEVRHVRNDR